MMSLIIRITVAILCGKMLFPKLGKSCQMIATTSMSPSWKLIQLYVTLLMHEHRQTVSLLPLERMLRMTKTRMIANGYPGYPAMRRSGSFTSSSTVIQPPVRNSPQRPSVKNTPSVAVATKIPQPVARATENSRYGFRREIRQPTHFGREGYKTAPARPNQGQNNFRGSAKIRPTTRCGTRTFKNSRCSVNLLCANFRFCVSTCNDIWQQSRRSVMYELMCTKRPSL